MSLLIKTLERMKESKRPNHEAVIQVKIPVTLRDVLNEALEHDGLSYKDLILAAIETYLKERKQ